MNTQTPTNNTDTHYSKGRDGWKGETNIPLGQSTGESDNGTRVLCITTHKVDGGRISTSASCHVHTADGFTRFTFSYGKTGDYNKRVAAIAARCTENTIKEQHNRVLTYQLDTIKQEALAHYEGRIIVPEPAVQEV